jgi:hypothetical protein
MADTVWTAQVGRMDEDGYITVIILADGAEVERHTLFGGQDVQAWAAEEVYLRNRMETDEVCEHGLSAALCSGPMHY